MTTTLPSLTIAKTGLVDGVPALIAFVSSKQTDLLVRDGAEWVVRETVAFGGIRGMGILAKKLDAGTARKADALPCWEEETEEEPVRVYAAEEVAAGQAEAAATADLDLVQNGIGTAPETEDTSAPHEPVYDESPPTALEAAFGIEAAKEIETTTDLAVLRRFREQAVKAGAHDAAKAIALRAGEVVLGMSLASLKAAKAPKAATEPKEKKERAPRPASGPVAYSDVLATLLSGREADESGVISIPGAEFSEALGFPATAREKGNFWRYDDRPGRKAATAIGFRAEWKAGTVLFAKQ